MEKLGFSDLAFQIKDEERKLGHQTSALALEYTRHLQYAEFNFFFSFFCSAVNSPG